MNFLDKKEGGACPTPALRGGMNLFGFCLRGNNKSGIIMIVVLWILAILSILAIGLGRTARIDLALTKHRIGKLKADFLSWASLNARIWPSWRCRETA